MMGQFTGHHASIRRERDGATGDAVIQHNTMHAWKNPTSAPVYLGSGAGADPPARVMRRSYGESA